MKAPAPSQTPSPPQEDELRERARKRVECMHGSMYAGNEILVTSDAEFIDYIIDARPRHAEIIYIPRRLTPDEKALFAALTRGSVLGALDREGPFAMRRIVLYPGDDGLREIARDGRDALVVSWFELAHALDSE